ncbi:MAG TPA: CapA family protein [Candidatus Paceibacterota bacterium]|nr:CapA family protein [Candidatus Paceibacterota bacterium]HRY76570.1 CapA family protein [Candidatus Paceibacterota bacterium]
MTKRTIIYVLLTLTAAAAAFLFLNKKPPETNPTISPSPSPQNNEVAVLFLGDVMLSRGVAYQIYQNNDLYYPFYNIRALLQQNDFVFANFESPLIPGRQIHTGEMAFRVDENLAPVLKGLNFSILSLANNHMLDFGQKGLSNTLKILDENKIQYIGAGENYQEAHQYKILEKNDIKIAFLAYNDNDVILATNEATENRPGTAFMDLGALKMDLAEAKKSADFVIISIHSGTEYEENPNNRQIKFAHAAIDSGANLVIGHHPHVVQPIEKYENGYIFYSLGNCVFDQAWSKETTEGIAAQIVFTKNEIKDIKILPLLIENYSQPKIISQNDNQETFQGIINRLKLPVDPIFSF